MGIPRDINLSYPDADDVTPAIATRVIAPHDADASTGEFDEIPPERFIGRGVVVRVGGFDDKAVIPFSAVAEQIDEVAPGDIVLFDTGWARLHGGTDRSTNNFATDHPTFDPGIVAALIVRGVLAVGVDAPRLDPPAMSPGPCAHLLAAAGGIVCVNLTNLDEVDFADPLITLTVGPRLTRTSYRVDATAVAIV